MTATNQAEAEFWTTLAAGPAPTQAELDEVDAAFIATVDDGIDKPLPHIGVFFGDQPIADHVDEYPAFEISMDTDRRHDDDIPCDSDKEQARLDSGWH